MTNPLKDYDAGSSIDDKKYAKCPPDMPRGDSPADKVARMRFWVEYGNRDLALKCRNDCLWVIRNGELRLETIA
jgi:hypothetical protein